LVDSSEPSVRVKPESSANAEVVMENDGLTPVGRARAAAHEAELAQIREPQQQRAQERARLDELEARMAEVRATQAELAAEMTQLRASQAGPSRIVKREPGARSTGAATQGGIIDLTDG
jgi:septal ring factor EnvC (AmiA/AmiB activator)